MYACALSGIKGNKENKHLPTYVNYVNVIAKLISRYKQEMDKLRTSRESKCRSAFSLDVAFFAELPAWRRNVASKANIHVASFTDASAPSQLL